MFRKRKNIKKVYWERKNIMKTRKYIERERMLRKNIKQERTKEYKESNKIKKVY